MSRLVAEIARRIRERMQASSHDVNGEHAELRSVFHGPPMEFLRPIYEGLLKDGGIEVQDKLGQFLRVPVILVVGRLAAGQQIPLIGESGICDTVNITNLRNSPDCPRYVLLVPPGCHIALTNTSATDSFGLAADSNSGNATTEDWLRDELVHDLITAGCARGPSQTEADREQARSLVEKAVRAADEVERHGVSRYLAWCVLSRLFAITGSAAEFPTMVSLACGFPPMQDGTIQAEEQAEVLAHLSSDLEEEGFNTGIGHIKSDADPADREALDAFLAHLQRTCDVPTMFGRAAPFYYGPLQDRDLAEPPQWWRRLTVERWLELHEEERRPDGTLYVKCGNSIIPPCKGLPALVLQDVALDLAIPGEHPDPLDATVTRLVGSAANKREWSVRVEGDASATDTALPAHRTPIRYTIAADQFKRATVRVVSLSTWEPGVFVYCRTASKISLFKRSRARRENISLECAMTVIGEGRHYVDVYVAIGVRLAEATRGYDAAGLDLDSAASPVVEAGEQLYGLEIDASGDCYFDLTMHRDQSEPETIRINVSCEEYDAEGCRSEFERLIRLNRQRDERRALVGVQLDRQIRSSDLQTWILDKRWVAESYFPLVLSSDYSAGWSSPNWRSMEKAILSSGRFLHDPRPSVDEMQVPAALIAARAEIARRIRGNDNDGLTESARLGDWLATDVGFSELVEQYVQAYLAWLESSPENAVWMDLAIVCPLEPDGVTLSQEPDAVLVNPLHPLRLAWHCLAQRVLFQAYKRHMPCPAASVLDAGSIPDALVLPLRTPTGAIQPVAFFAVESSSDYWAVLWNASRLDRLPTRAGLAPFDREFGVQIGGVSSGFSAAQVHRALDDVREILAAKPVISVMISSAAGQTNACNEGLLSWCRERFAQNKPQELTAMGPRMVQILDERKSDARPDDAEISNLAEDTGNCVKWFAAGTSTITPDLGIVAQLETSNPGQSPDEVGSPVGIGGLIRHRVRRQLQAGSGAFLLESRMGSTGAPSGDGLADKLSSCLVRFENLGDQRLGYTFAPSVSSIKAALSRADFAAVSSSAVDPACFLGGWLPESYLWDYDLPSYSHRSGDTNGYYLLSRVKDIDFQTLGAVLARLPGCREIPEDAVRQIILEVARRGIPTVRGLAAGDSGAAGDLGLLIASRLLQDEFRESGTSGGLLPILLEGEDGTHQIVLVIPVDPFRGYLDDLQRALRLGSIQRPDLLVAGIVVTDSRVTCRLTPIEVKYRGGATPMPVQTCNEALGQARSLASLLLALRERAEDAELLLWKVAYHHLLVSMLSFGFRVYSQRRVAFQQSKDWTQLHARCVHAILNEEVCLDVDSRGRLIVIDGSTTSAPRDNDSDGFKETIGLSPGDAASIVRDPSSPIFAQIRDGVGDWQLLPQPAAKSSAVPPPPPSQGGPASTGHTDSGSSSGAAGPSPQAQPEHVEEPAAGYVTIPEEPPSPPDGGAAVVQVSAGQQTHPPSTTSHEPGVQLLVGNTVDGFKSEPRTIRLSDTDLTQLNLGIVGDLGTGKTQLLKSLIYQTFRAKEQNQGVTPRFLIFDYKQDYCAPDFVQAVHAHVIKPHHLPINLFDVSGAGNVMTPWLERFKFFSDVLDKIYSGVGPVQRKQLKEAVRQAYEECASGNRQPTLYDIHSRYSAILGGRIDSPLSIIDDLVDMELFSSDPESMAHFDDFLDGVVVIDLSALGQDDRTKNMLVAIMLNLFYEHMLKIPKRPYVGTHPQLRVIDSFLLVDEADNIMRYQFDVLRKILLQGREFGVGVILASQYLSHFKSGPTDYREPLLTWCIHKVPNITPQELSALGLSVDLPQLTERVKGLARHQCLLKTHGIAGEVISGIPFYELVTGP
jgi:DNA phosphorothioation-dependent restriction protein DptH